MIKGMTGFGHAQFSIGNVKGIVEIKSLNHRYFDITYYLPPGFSSIENKIKQLLEKEVNRGRITVSVRFLQKSSTNVTLNKETVKTYLSYAKQLKSSFGLENDLALSDIFKLPGVFEVKENILEPDAIWPTLEKNLQTSLKNLSAMRKAEGRSLAIDVNDKLTRMAAQIRNIEARHKLLLTTNKKTMTSEEFMSFQKSTDINEELARLGHYIDELKLLLKSDAPIGKKIDFIAQEMQRETNTVGSKLQDKLVSNAVITLKSKIEKIREQSQNIE